MSSCVDRYLELSHKLGIITNLKDVATPFVSEDHSCSKQGKPSGEGPAILCPYCRYAFSQV